MKEKEKEVTKGYGGFFSKRHADLVRKRKELQTK